MLHLTIVKQITRGGHMNDKANILIVDDEEVVRRSHLRSLEGTNCSTRAAEDGNAALHVMEQHPADVVLLDLRFLVAAEVLYLDGDLAVDTLRVVGLQLCPELLDIRRGRGTSAAAGAGSGGSTPGGLAPALPGALCRGGNFGPFLDVLRHENRHGRSRSRGTALALSAGEEGKGAPRDCQCYNQPSENKNFFHLSLSLFRAH